MLEADPVSDQLGAAEICGYDPIIMYEWNLGKHNPDLEWEVAQVRQERGYTEITKVLHSPYGMVRTVVREQGGNFWVTEYPLKSEEDYRVAEWYLDEMIRTADAVQMEVREAREQVGDRGLLCCRHSSGVGVGAWGSTAPNASDMDAIYHEHDFPKTTQRLSEKMNELTYCFVQRALKGGADLIFFGAPGEYMCSAQTFQEKHLPRLKALSDFIKAHGGHSFLHM
jgi:hypothetical protein